MSDEDLRILYLLSSLFVSHHENLPMKYTENLSAVKTENFIGKILIFLISLLKTMIIVGTC